MDRILSRMRGLVPPTGIRHRTEPETPPANPAPGEPGNPTPPEPPASTPPEPPTTPPTEPAKPNPAETRIQRERDAAVKRAEAAEQKLKDAEDAKLGEKERAERERDDAKAAETAANERADKTEVRSKLRLRAPAKTASAEALVDLSEGKLLELKGATDEELDAHIDETVKKYSLPAAGKPGDPTPTPRPFGGPPAPGTPPGGDPAAPRAPEATGDAKKDYRAGVGMGILGLLRGRGEAPASGDGDED